MFSMHLINVKAQEKNRFLLFIIVTITINNNSLLTSVKAFAILPHNNHFTLWGKIA